MLQFSHLQRTSDLRPFPFTVRLPDVTGLLTHLQTYLWKRDSDLGFSRHNQHLLRVFHKRPRPTKPYPPQSPNWSKPGNETAQITICSHFTSPTFAVSEEPKCLEISGPQVGQLFHTNMRQIVRHNFNYLLVQSTSSHYKLRKYQQHVSSFCCRRSNRKPHASHTHTPSGDSEYDLPGVR